MGMLSTADTIEERFMTEKPVHSEEPLWLLVDDGCQSTCVALMGETVAERGKRRNGTAESKGQTALRELSDEMNKFINKNRAAGNHEMLLTLVAAVSNEAAMLEASKFHLRHANSSIS